MTPVEFGGAEKVSLNLLKNIDRSRFDVRPILLIRPWEKQNVFLSKIEEEGYDYLTIPVALYKKSEKREYLRVARCFKTFWSIAKKQELELIHTNGYFADLIGIPVARLQKIPIISTCHGFIKNDIKLFAYNFLDHEVLRFTNKIIAVSQDIKNNLMRHGIRESKIVFIQNSVDTKMDSVCARLQRDQARSALNLKEDDFVIGYVGRLSEEKGIRFLIQAMSVPVDSMLQMHLLVVGDGPQKIELENLVKSKGLAERVVFMGFQSNPEQWLSAMDVFVLPSLTEGTPMALLEAMSCGLPIIASAVGGIPDVIESGQNGLLIASGQPTEITNAIVTLSTSKGLRNNLGFEAQKTVRDAYNVCAWINKIEDEYLKLLK